MVYICHNGIEIPSFQSSHIQFYMVPIRFFTNAYTLYTYTIMALTSSHSKVHIYISIWFFTDAYTWYFTDTYTWYTYTIMALTSPHSKVCIYGSIQFPYGSLPMPICCIHMLCPPGWRKLPRWH